MQNSDPYSITTVEQLRARLHDPHPATPKKLLTALDEQAIEFIGRSPFLVIGTADAEGNQDVSPKGDPAGFVAILDSHTLLIPERKGNRLAFGFRNILANPHVGLIFMVPDTDETLRVNGVAELTVDPAVLERLSARGAPAIMAMRVHVRECFFHCGKALIRSALWQPQSWPARGRISFGRYIAPGKETEQKLDKLIEQDYKNNL